jgi:hypothetical protein
MKLVPIIAEELNSLALFAEHLDNTEEAVSEFAQHWQALGAQILEQQLQQHIDILEAQHPGTHHRLQRTYASPMGKITFVKCQLSSPKIAR